VGYLNSDWVNPFTEGQTIKAIEKEGHYFYIIFKSGERLRLHADCEGDIITTPFDEKGQIKSAMDILKK